ncbi:MAG: regulator of sigma protease [Solirubrobacterales bacterium]|nr:regulator of sigma protease [Solirubrobacterales bacterium]
MNWLYIFLGFSLLIILHEGGHFLAAKATGMRVERFFLFFGPTLWSFKRGETEYGIKTIPLGGYVKITGMNPEEEVPPEHENRAYYRQPVWKRIVVVAAGPAVNIVLAFAILFFVAFSYPEVNNEIGSVEPQSPAAAAALRPGDRLVSVDGKRFTRAPEEDRLIRFGNTIASHECAEAKPTKGCRATTAARLEVEQGGRLRTFAVHPVYDPAVERTRVGIGYGSEAAADGGAEAVTFAWDKMWMVASGTFHVFAHIFEAEQRRQISGIVGTSDVANRVIDVGVTPALLLLALVSLSLGLINLLPILPLDGGHIFWALVEKLRGRPASLRVMERATMIGFALVMVLMVIGLTNDIGRIGSDTYNVR